MLIDASRRSKYSPQHLLPGGRYPLPGPDFHRLELASFAWRTASRLSRYTPELNPVERVWLHLNERFLSHRLPADYDAIADAASKAWNQQVADAGRLTSLCSYPWIPQVK